MGFGPILSIRLYQINQKGGEACMKEFAPPARTEPLRAVREHKMRLC